MPNRQFTPYEINLLRKHKFTDLSLIPDDNKPVEYIAGYASFLDNDFLVDTSTLIPRIESEQIVTMSIDFLKCHRTSSLNIADIGTGSGCLGLSVAKSLLDFTNNFDLWLSDISLSALNVAQRNSKILSGEYSNKLHFLQSNLLQAYTSGLKFDLIIANLPYIPSSRISTLDPSVKDYEPLSALDGGERGVSLINQLLTSIQKHLKPTFQIILEIDSLQTLNDFHLPPLFHAEIKTDCFQQPRFLVISNPC